MAEIWVKLESANPTGSYKDRMALAMIEGAERDGRLAPGQTVVEYTGGSTGSSLAYVCGLKGYPLRIVTSDAFAEEKPKTMRALGADVEIVPSPDGITPELIPRMIERSKEIVDEVGGFATDQFRNRDMLDGYAARTRAPRAAGRSARCVLRLYRDIGLLRRRHAGAAAHASRAPPGSDRACGVARDLGR